MACSQYPVANPLELIHPLLITPAPFFIRTMKERHAHRLARSVVECGGAV
jgi:hypothetical protein